MNDKLVSVIIPVYNADEHLRESINSVLNQDYPHIEVIVVNDGSTDDGFSKSIIEEFDGSIFCYEKSNSGLADTLNFAIEKSSGEYIARMDQDDICDSTRISEQVSFMEKNKDISVCGTYFDYIRNGSISEANEIPTCNEDIEFNMLFSNVICHPSVMFRASDIKGKWKYDTTAPAEDYELWTRMIGHVKFANIPKILLHYRINEKSITHTQSDKIARYDVVLHRRLLENVMGITSNQFKDAVLNNVLFSNKCSVHEKRAFIEDMYDYLNAICATQKFQELKKKYPQIEESLNSIWNRALSFSNICYKSFARKFHKSLGSFKSDSKTDLISALDEIEKMCKSIVKKPAKVVLCGAGTRCVNFLKEHNFLESEKNIKIIAILDNEKHRLCMGNATLPVYSINDISNMTYDYVFITSNKYYDELCRDLIGVGVDEEKIWSSDVIYFSEQF